MKKILLFLFVFTTFFSLNAQIDRYDKNDLVECLRLVLEYPKLQELFQRDINYQNEFNLVIQERQPDGRIKNIGTSSLQLLLQQIDQTDITQINSLLYLTQPRARTQPNEEYWTAEEQRRTLNLALQYDDAQDVLLINFYGNQQVEARKNIRYTAYFQLQKNDANWEMISDRLSLQEN